MDLDPARLKLIPTQHFGALLIASLAITLSLACSRLENSLDKKILLCGADTELIPANDLVFPSETDIEAVFADANGFRALARSSKSCLILPPKARGRVYVRLKDQKIGAVFTVGDSLSNKVQKLSLGQDTQVLQARSYELTCQSTYTQGLSASLNSRGKESSRLELYQLNYRLLQNQNELARGQLPLLKEGEQMIPLPSTLAEGRYTLEFSVLDVFSAGSNGIQDTPLSCPITIDRSAPEITDFGIDLKKIASEKDGLIELAPSQSLNLKLKDEGPSQSFYCLYEEASPACDIFSQVNGPINIENQGIWRLRYYTQDAASNRSSIQNSGPMAVVHRDSMRNIQNTISLARLENQRAFGLDAARILLEAYQAYDQLKLKLEREALSEVLGFAYSEIARNLDLAFNFRDHGSTIKKFETLAKKKYLLSLDQSGVLVVRQEGGSLIKEWSAVADFSVTSNENLLVVFQDGSYQWDVNGERQALNLPSKPIQIIHLQEDQNTLLVASNDHISLHRWNAPSFQQVWQQSLKNPVRSMYWQSSEILILATDSELIQLDGHSGVESYHFAWDKRCQLAKLIQTRSYDYYIGLKTLRGYVSAEVFHCEMLHWQGASADPQKVLASSFLQKDNFTGFDPDKFRIEELLELNYNSQRNWLLISRSLDSRFILYDLNQNKGEIITLTQDGFPRIVRVSDNGKFLTLAWALVGKNSLQIYSIPDADKLMSLNDIFSEAPLLDLQNRPKSISDIGFSEAHDMIFTADEARQINSYSLQETLLPKSPDQFIVPTQISKNQTALSWIHGQLKRLDPYGRVLNTWEPPSGIEFTQALDTDDGPLALDGFGKLWSHGLAPDSNEWKTIDTAALNQAKLVVSPSQQLALVFGKDRETGVGQVYLLKKDGHTWLQVATLQADGEQAAFSANEEYFALAGRKEQSLWTTDGTLLQKLKQANESFQAGLRYQAFSADSSLWLLRFGNKLRFFDTIHREFLKQDITLQFQPGYVGFAGTDHEHLWVGTRGGGTSQFLYEMNLYGQISRDFGEFTSMIVEVFNFQDRLLAVDKIGQVLSLKTARESAEVLIASSMQKTSELLDYQADKGLLLVTPNAQAEHQFLFLNFAPEHVDSLCAWLLPTLRAAADEEAQGQLEFCQQRLTKAFTKKQ